MRNVLVTGANGFIGKALVSKLKKDGFCVICFGSSDGDISEFDFVKEYNTLKIDYVFHLASKTFVPNSWTNPLEFYKTSVLGTGNVLELCRNRNIPCTFVSAYLYGLPDKLPISEKDRIKPNNPYANSKYLAEELCRFYSEYYNVKVVIARPFNIYGKNQKDVFLIPHKILQALNNKEIKVKSLQPKRDYIYVDDFVEGLMKTIDAQKQFSVYNFGSGVELSVQEVICVIQKTLGINKKIVLEKQERQNEIMNTIADISKAKHDLGWEPKISFEEGIKRMLRGLGYDK